MLLWYHGGFPSPVDPQVVFWNSGHKDNTPASASAELKGGTRHWTAGLSSLVISYPLVNIQKAMERSTIFNGKIHYFDWAIFNSKLLVHQRVVGDSIQNHGEIFHGQILWLVGADWNMAGWHDFLIIFWEWNVIIPTDGTSSFLIYCRISWSNTKQA